MTFYVLPKIQNLHNFSSYRNSKIGLTFYTTQTIGMLYVVELTKHWKKGKKSILTLYIYIFEFLRQNWKIFLNISFYKVSSIWIFVPKIKILTQNWTYKKHWKKSILTNFTFTYLNFCAKNGRYSWIFHYKIEFCCQKSGFWPMIVVKKYWKKPISKQKFCQKLGSKNIKFTTFLFQVDFWTKYRKVCFQKRIFFLFFEC